eukprot:TRINITY_DN525_c1_g1_i1.p1 TRINITY_DN525_c1_g1~~TRINITY_DN525_c1_g1_i1.p1  ORF type:complete len:716 (+),score=147.30 TRINITY_DN525_c1_g1_i1:290-2437(+)
MTEEDATEKEKRFQQIMEKLFHASDRSSSSSAGVELGRKRLKSIPTSRPELGLRGDIVQENSLKRSLVQVGSQAPLCRPWERGDLTRRLATFKSMTWFGKPKAVSPINCACRGWVNVEMDIIACEACGARLLFSTPSSWTQQQVEKAAAVFSLKLDSGHKLLCPWINNACDETLALFPPTPAATLAEGYRERCRALLRLLALPVISSSAIDYMKCPQLENFLAQSSHLPQIPSEIIQPSTSSGSKNLINEPESGSANSYYQALKIISLCGWELRMLPYAVDCEDQSTQSVPDATASETSPQFVSGQSNSIVIYSSTASDEVARAKEDSLAPGELQYDPASVVLNCRRCGASVGLWAFLTAPRPLEFFRITESTEVNGRSKSANSGKDVASQGLINIYDLGREILDQNRGIVSTFVNGSAVSRERPFSLNLTIAGGPPPTKQNFRATVSLPIISRHLRAGFSSISDPIKSESSTMLGISQENDQSNLQIDNSSHHDKDDRMDDTHPRQNTRSEDVGELKRKRHDDELYVSRDNNLVTQSILNTEVDQVDNACRSEESGDKSHDGEPSNKQETPSANSSQRMQNMATILGRKDKLPEGTEDAAVCAESEAFSGSQAQESMITTPESNGTIEHSKNGSDPRLAQWDTKMEFDPIRHHRHFCPWIASADAASMCGWKLTLSALDHEKESSHDPPLYAPSTSSILKVGCISVVNPSVGMI